MRRYRRWTIAQKRQVVERMSSCRHAKLAEEIGIPQRQRYSWRKDLRRLQGAEEGEEVSNRSREKRLERENEQLKQALGKKVVEADFLQGVLRRIEARRQPSSGSGETASTKRSK
jgi:transposase-like protein